MLQKFDVVELIPYERLSEGFEKAQFQVKSLLESSQAVLNEKHYSVSIALSILAFEECYKMQMFQHAIDEKNGINEEEWIVITKGDKKRPAHVVKSQRFYKDSKQYVQSRGEESSAIVEEILKKIDPTYKVRKFSEKIEQKPEVIERLSGLNSIKNSCFYLDWKDDNWYFFNNKSKKERKSFAEFLIWFVEIFYCHRIANHLHPIMYNDENSKEFKDFMNDSHTKRAHELEKLEKDKKFKITIMLGRKILDEFRGNKNNKSGNQKATGIRKT